MNYTELSNSDKLKSLVKFGKLIESANLTTSETEQQKLFIVASNAESLYKSIKKEEAIEKDTRKLLSKIYNTANSLMDSLAESEVSDFNEEGASTLRRRIRRLEKNVKANLKSELAETASIYGLPDKPTGPYKNLSKSDLREIAATLSQDGKKEIKEVIDSNKKVIDGLQSKSSSLPKTVKDVKGTFIIKRLPIVVISNLGTKDFEAMGAETQKVGMYDILKDQLVVAVNPNSEIVKNTGVKEYLNTVVKSIGHKDNEKYHIAKDVSSYKQSGLKYYWIVPESNINRMLKETGNHFDIRKWGFAFN